MTGIDSLPPDSSFGMLFDYSVWGPGTEVTLCNVPWDSMYRDVYHFDEPAQTIKYINDYNSEYNNPTVHIKNLTYCAQNMPVRISLPFSEANIYNYLIVQNSSFPISQKNRATTFFYFIQSVEYVAPETTQLTLMLDVWQTYHHLLKVTDAFVERSHMLEYEEKYLRDNSPVFNWQRFARTQLTANESFDIGDRHYIWRGWQASLTGSLGDTSSRFDYTAIIVSTINLEGDYGTEGNPSLSTAYGSKVPYSVPTDDNTGYTDGGTVVSGATLYSCDISKLPDVMAALSKAPWISQGIQDIYYVPKPAVATVGISGKAAEAGLNKVVKVFTKSGLGIIKNSAPNDHIWYLSNNNLAVSKNVLALLKRFTKFFTSPYCYYDITANNGQVITIAPERNRTSSEVNMYIEWHVLPPSPRIVCYPQGYNGLPLNPWKSDQEYVNESIVIDNFPHVPVVNDQSSIWYASHARSIAQSRSSASWGLDKATRAAQNSFDQTMHGIRTSNAIMENNLGAQNLNTALANTAQMAHQQVASANRAISGIGGAVGSALTNPVKGIGQLGSYFQGQVTADISTGIDINARNMSNVISQNTARANLSEQNALTGSNAAANKELAQWSAQGDYQQQIAAINASVRDAEITPPTVSGASGGDAFNWLINGCVLHAHMRMVGPDVVIRQGRFWERYGYVVNQFFSGKGLPAGMRAMSRFTYWKCKDVRISGSGCPQYYIDTIRGIFEKGVTVWHEPLKKDENYFDVARDNQPHPWKELNW